MAVVTDKITEFDGGQVWITMSYDDTTGEIQQLGWNVPNGTLSILIHNPPKADIPVTIPGTSPVRPRTGTLNVPAGQYSLSPGTKGGWVWAGAISYQAGWTGG